MSEYFYGLGWLVIDAKREAAMRARMSDFHRPTTGFLLRDALPVKLCMFDIEASWPKMRRVGEPSGRAGDHTMRTDGNHASAGQPW